MTVENSAPEAPLLLFLIGPPAVGKMTVGQAIADRTGLRLFHNHMTIEPVLRFFEFGTPPFNRLVQDFRTRLLEEVAASDLPGLIFTYVWAFGHPGEQASIDSYAAPFRARGGRILYVELAATQEERLRRNEGDTRLAEKPSKRDSERSRRLLLDMDSQYRLTSADEFAGNPDYLHLDNTTLSPEEAADRIIARFGLA
jgi:hypothetical protein